MTGNWWLLGGLAASFLALAAAFVALLGWRSNRLSIDRRTRPGTAAPEGALAAPSRRLSALFERGLTKIGRIRNLTVALDLAGLTMSPGDFTLLVLSATLAAGAAGLVLAGPIMAILLALLAPAGATIFLKLRASRRRAAFEDQLEESLQLLSGSLRAGHSLLRALDAAAQESEKPTSDEFGRVINETRVGRPLGDSLDETAQRMASKDFSWIAQAIAIHREVGGDLAEVLDIVGQTIRERNQIRRLVKSLSAEGRMSGIVLILLPFGVAGFLMLANPGYLSTLTDSLVGWCMIAAAGVMITIGGLWLRKIVTFTF
jgi:tight adherence protein B